MKKILLLLVACLFSMQLFSQVRIGLRLAPGLTFNRVKDKTSLDALDFKSGGVSSGFSAGVNFDIMIKDNYGLMLGLWYTSKMSNIKADSAGFSFQQRVSLQYVQMPVAIKLYTNEIATNMKLYFLVGGTIDVKVAEKLKKQESSDPNITSADYQKHFQPYNVGILAGAGVEYETGGNVILFAGLTYNRGFVNQVKNKEILNGQAWTWKDGAKYNTDMLAIELGAKF